jgi:DNA-binding FrmR family transcriptional regulator
MPAGQVAPGCGPPPRPATRPRPVRGYASGKEDYLRRLRKIEGQVRGLQKIIEADTWCPDVVTQVASATRALQEVAAGLLNDHLRTCVTGAAAARPPTATPGWARSPPPSARSSGCENWPPGLAARWRAGHTKIGERHEPACTCQPG